MTQQPPPWTPERAVSSELACELIEAQFPDLRPVTLRPFGIGWDNTVYLVNGSWVFRFPRRRIAVDCLETEMRIVPGLASQLPLPISVPSRVGVASASYPWPFAGYRHLPGRTACRADLDAAERLQLAEPLGRFLAALHRVDGADAPADELGRLDLATRVPGAQQNLGRLEQLGLIEDPEPWLRLLGQTSGGAAGRVCLVHGDLYARHLLIDAQRRLVGVIDWGDLHRGDPAVDLSIAHAFLPAAARDRFRHAYGEIAGATWERARFRALYHELVTAIYGHELGDDALLRESLLGLRQLL